MFGVGVSSNSQSSSGISIGSSRSGSSSTSGSNSTSQATSGSAGRSFTDIAFEDIFSSLYGEAGGAAKRAADMAPGFSEQAQQLFSGGLDFLDQLGGGGDVTRDTNLLDEQIGGLGEDLGRFFREELNPAITSRGVATGTLGGGRQGVAQGRAAGDVAREFQRGSTALRVADQTQREALAVGNADRRLQSSATGLNALPGLLGVSQAGFGAELAPWEALAGIVGGPTTLSGSEQSSFSQSTAEEVAQAIASSFGMSDEYSAQQSKGKGSSFKV